MKYAWMETHSDLFSVSRMSRLLDVSRTGYCQWRVRNAKRALDRQRDARCTGRSDSRRDETQLRSAAHRAGSARERCSGGPRAGAQELDATDSASGL